MPSSSMTKNSTVENLDIKNFIRFKNGDKLRHINPLDIGDFRIFESKGTLCFMIKAPGENSDRAEHFRNHKIVFKMRNA